MAGKGGWITALKPKPPNSGHAVNAPPLHTALVRRTIIVSAAVRRDAGIGFTHAINAISVPPTHLGAGVRAYTPIR